MRKQELIKEVENLKFKLNAVKEIQNKYLILKDGILKKDLITAITKVYEDGKYNIIINTNTNITKIYPFEKNEKSKMEEEFKKIIKQII